MKNHYQHLLSSQFEQDALKEIDKLLSEEFDKPEQNRDYDMIDELTDIYSSLAGMDKQIDEASESGMIALKEKMQSIHRPHFTRRIRLLITAACVALVMLTANLITVSAFDMNIFSFIVHFADNGFSIDFPLFSNEVPDDDIIELPVTPDDPYGMIAESAKYGIYPETPHYLPDNYVLTICENRNVPPYVQDVQFTFTNQHNTKQVITFSFELYGDKEYISGTKFPNTEHRLSEIKINGKPAILAEEWKDKQFTIVYCMDTLLIAIFTQDISREEVNQVISSMK